MMNKDKKIIFFFFQQVDNKNLKNYENFNKLVKKGSTSIIKFREIKENPIIEEYLQFFGISNVNEILNFNKNMKISVFSNETLEDFNLKNLKNFKNSTYETTKEIFDLIEKDDSNLLILQINCQKSNEILEKFNEIFGKLNENYWLNFLMTFQNEIEFKKKKFEFEQSYNRKFGNLIENLSENKIGILCSYFGDYTRVDNNQIFDIENCLKHSGFGSMLVDHILIEISFKLGFSSKYGA